MRGFKSLRDVRLEARRGFVLLVGPNGSGKTALVESLLLLRDVVGYLRGRVVNPFLRWWGYGNVVWRGDETRPIELGVGLDCSSCSEGELREWLEKRFGVSVRKDVAGLVGDGVEYWVVVSGAGGGFTIVREKLCIKGLGCTILEGGRLSLRIEEEAAEKLAKEAIAGLSFTLQPFVVKELYRREAREVLAAVRSCASEAIRSGRDRVNELTEVLGRLLQEKPGLPLTGTRSLLEFYVERLGKERYEIDALEEAEALVSSSLGLVAEKVAYSSPLRRLVERYLDCMASRAGVEAGLDRIAELVARDIVDSIFPRVVAVFLVSAVVVGAFIDSIVVLRLLDYRGLRSPQLLEPGEVLREDGSNLVSVLFRLGRGRLPEEVAEVLAAVLGAGSVTGFFEPTPDGRVVLRLNVDGLVLAPPSIPEGAWKTMALMAAVLSGAGLVAVDEFENSLHASAQELLLEELRGNVPTVVVATHSPIVVDSAKSLDEIVVVELEAGETRLRRVESPEALAARLRELGVSPSEALLYGILDSLEEREGAAQ